MAIFNTQHHPWAFTFGILGNIVSVFVYLAPLPTFFRIYSEKSTMGFDSLPYVVALFSAMLWMYYAVLKTNSTLLISINSFGCFIETIYIFVFVFYASRRARIHAAKLLGLMNLGLMSLIFLLTFFVFEGQIRVHVVGWVCVAVSVCVFAAPLSILLQVVRTRSIEFMPFPLSFFLTLSAVMWFAYGVLQKDLCIALPNVLGFLLGVLQMVLYGIFRRRTRPEIIEEKKAESVEQQMMNIMIVGTPEVFPIDSHKRCRDIEADDDDGHRNEEDEEEINNVEQIAESSPAILVVCAAA